MNTTGINLAQLYAAYDKALADTKKHAPMGYIDGNGMAAVYRCAAREFGCTPEDAERWIKARPFDPRLQ